MRTRALTISIICLLGFAHAVLKLESDGTGTPVPCFDEPAPTRVTCGACKETIRKVFIDHDEKLIKMSVACASCSNGIIPVTTAIAYTTSFSDAINDNMGYVISMASRCECVPASPSYPACLKSSPAQGQN